MNAGPCGLGVCWNKLAISSASSAEILLLEVGPSASLVFSDVYFCVIHSYHGGFDSDLGVLASFWWWLVVGW